MNHDQLRCAIVIGVAEDSCRIIAADKIISARFAPSFPTPYTERVSPGNLVALTSGATRVVLWRWYDAVVLDTNGSMITLWEPAHGTVRARPRPLFRPVPLGSRAYLSAGLPGANWWVCGPAVSQPEQAEVDLDEVSQLYTEHDLWPSSEE